jgi:Arc/MetJ-type ribon-helix-helix transcriptional regulator
MTYHFPPDVEQLVRDGMSSGRYATEDDLLREALLTLSTADQDLAAVQEAIVDLESGELGLPLAEAFDAVRRDSGVTDQK